MAKIKKIKSTWYSRVRWYDENGHQREKQISLRTKKKSEATIRNNQVSQVEDTIASGENWSFPWMNQRGKVELIKLSTILPFIS